MDAWLRIQNSLPSQSKRSRGAIAEREDKLARADVIDVSNPFRRLGHGVADRRKYWRE